MAAVAVAAPMMCLVATRAAATCLSKFGECVDLAIAVGEGTANAVSPIATPHTGTSYFSYFMNKFTNAFVSELIND